MFFVSNRDFAENGIMIRLAVLQDQLVVFMTMAAGTSRLRLGSCSTSRSLHMQTAP